MNDYPEEDGSLCGDCELFAVVECSGCGNIRCELCDGPTCKECE